MKIEAKDTLNKFEVCILIKINLVDQDLIFDSTF